jgi:hypothetical protein
MVTIKELRSKRVAPPRFCNHRSHDNQVSRARLSGLECVGAQVSLVPRHSACYPETGGEPFRPTLATSLMEAATAVTLTVSPSEVGSSENVRTTKRTSPRWIGVPGRRHANHGEKACALFIEFGSKTARERFEARSPRRTLTEGANDRSAEITPALGNRSPPPRRRSTAQTGGDPQNSRTRQASAGLTHRPVRETGLAGIGRTPDRFGVSMARNWKNGSNGDMR